MAAAGVEEDPAFQAARILVTIRNRRLLRWPEWVQKEPPASAAAAVEACWPLEGWPKRQRSGRRLPSDWRAALALPKLGLAAASALAGSGACSSGEDRERSPAPARWKERSRATPPRDEPTYYGAPSGSGPSTSADRRARREKPAAAAASKAPAAAVVAAPAKEPMMKASSPETPLDFGADAAGSGASSSWDEAARPPSKRRSPGARGSGGGGGTSSGDEGCSSPDKRARVDAGDGHGQKAISEPKMHAPDDGDKGVKFAFDLNMPCPEDDEGFC